MTKNENSFIKFMATYDKRWVYVVIFLIVYATVLSPIGLPVSVSPTTREYLDVLETLEPGDPVLYNLEVYFASYRELQAGVLASMKVMVDQGAYICISTDRPEGVGVITIVLQEMESYFERAGYVYGEQYIAIGYVFPNEPAYVSVAEDFHAVIRTDWQGNSIEGTFLDNINRADDWSLLTAYSDGTSTSFINHYTERYGTRLITNCIGVCVPLAAPYKDAGYFLAVLPSTRGGAELEYLINEPGPGLTAMDAFSLGHFALVLFMIIGNIGYFGYTKRVGDKERTAI